MNFTRFDFFPNCGEIQKKLHITSFQYLIYKFLVVQVNSSLLGFCQCKHSNFKSLTYFMALNLHIQVTKMKNYTCENNDNELLHEVLAIKMGSNGSSCHVVR